jgi:O-antigen ligase
MSARSWVAVTALPGAAALGAITACMPSSVVMGSALAGLVSVAARYPGIILAAYLCVPPFFKAFLQPHVPVDVTLLLAALCVPSGVALLSAARPPFFHLGLWISLPVLMAASVSWSVSPTLALDRLAYWVVLGVFPLLAAVRVASDDMHISQFLRTLLVAATIVTAGSLAGFDATERLEIFDVIGTGRAALLLPIFAVAMSSDRSWRLAAIALSPLALYVTLAAGTRGPLVALGITLVVWAVVTLRRRAVGSLLTAVALAGIGYAAMVAVAPELPTVSVDRVLSLGFLSGDVGTSEGVRLLLFDVAATAFQEHPLTGIGLGQFALLMPGFTYPHNIVLQFAAELGILGVSLLVTVLFVAFGRRDLPGPAWTTVRLLAVFFLANALVSSDALEFRLLWGALALLLFAPHPHLNTPTWRVADAPS